MSGQLWGGKRWNNSAYDYGRIGVDESSFPGGDGRSIWPCLLDLYIHMKIYAINIRAAGLHIFHQISIPNAGTR